MPERLAALGAAVLRHAGRPGAPALPRVGLHVSTEAGRMQPSVYRPMCCVVLQGAKEVMIGDRTLRYDTATYFISSVDVPASGCIVEASPETPYVCASLALDRDGLASVLADAGDTPVPRTRGFAVAAMTPELLDAWGRMLALLDRPAEVPVMAPLIEREILFRLLQGPHGELVRETARSDGRPAQIRDAIAHIRANFSEPLPVDRLARIAGMSVASFHRHFRATTAMSPLQYQKALRLQEARRLLIASSDAARAAYAVGYESASQFSREYARMFGIPPSRDVPRPRRAGLTEGVAA